MAIRKLKAIVTGIAPLLQNNPQTVDRFNVYSREMAKINAKKTRRTDEDYRTLGDIEVRSKVHWDDSVGVFMPSTCLMAAICKNSFSLKKIAKDRIRGSVFMDEFKLPLQYRDSDKVRTLDDIVGNSEFRFQMNLKQGQVRIVKHVPIFHKWSFEASLEYDDLQMDGDDLEAIIKYSAQYGGFGDFRPTFGRAVAEVTHS
jgi:hypothetical protein